MPGGIGGKLLRRFAGETAGDRQEPIFFLVPAVVGLTLPSIPTWPALGYRSGTGRHSHFAPGASSPPVLSCQLIDAVAVPQTEKIQIQEFRNIYIYLQYLEQTAKNSQVSPASKLSWSMLGRASLVAAVSRAWCLASVLPANVRDPLASSASGPRPLQHYLFLSSDVLFTLSHMPAFVSLSSPPFLACGGRHL